MSNENLKTGHAGIELIKSFEGLRLNAYRDPVGIWTIGYGHTAGVYEGQKITAAEAENLLKEDLTVYENAVKRYITYELNQNQFDALVSFTYNVGSGNLMKSVLRELLNKGYPDKAADEFRKWTYAGGKCLEGLVRRRAAEKALFLKEDESLSKGGGKMLETIYDKLDEIPEYARPTIERLVARGLLKGDEKGNLGLTETAIKIFVVNDRAGLY